MDRTIDIPPRLKKFVRVVDRDDFVAGITNEGFLTLFHHWESVRQNDQLPKRSDIDPVALGKIIASVVMIDCSDPLNPRVRIGGGDIEERHNTSLRNKYYKEVLDPAEAGRMIAITNFICTQRIAMHGHSKLPREGLHSISGERMVLPLSEDCERVTDVIYMAISNYRSIGNGQRVDVGKNMTANVWLC